MLISLEKAINRESVKLEDRVLVPLNKAISRELIRPEDWVLAPSHKVFLKHFIISLKVGIRQARRLEC